MELYNFKTAYTQARDLYGVELKALEFENIGLIAWDRIGNKQYRLYRYEVEPTKDSLGDYYIDLPCNVDIIESVTGLYEDASETSNIGNYGMNQNRAVENYIETGKRNTNNLYSPGKFVKYTVEENRLRIGSKFSKIFILYKGIIVDEEGLPFLNVKELDAIAVFCAYSSMFKNALVTKDSASMQMAQLLEQKWKSLCSQARIQMYLNQNDMDEILNVSVGWDRKRFGKSFKPIR